ncbi:keratin, type I cytoskeletal 50 kDa-like [Narcine bancroftii]|uniref:keratin, type I cytoskeletal 50 kDa-like n=1 Tax=Narcine bancroftii TaxID=1343680 RepID=UPI0038320E0C
MSFRPFSSQSLMLSSGSVRKPFLSGGGASYGGFTSTSSMGMRGRSMGMGKGLGLSSGFAGGFSASGISGGTSSSSVGIGGGLSGNEKEAMIDQNRRLELYLEKVKILEKSNTDMELKLKEFQVGTALATVDYASYDEIIKPLREQILQLHLGNARLALDLDNSSLAAKDFQAKYENEFCTRQSVEADIADLKGMKEEYIHNCKELEGDINAAKEELVYLRKNHEEELVQLRQQVTGTVTVSVESASNFDLTKELAELRENYVNICKKNQDDMNTWYTSQVEAQAVQTIQVNKATEDAKVELSELRHRYQALDTEYNSLLSANMSLERNLQDINDSFLQQQEQLMMRISCLEMELSNLRNDIIQKTKEYTALLNIKMQLENEIAKYRKLLQSSESISTTSTGGQESSGTTTTIKTIETTKRVY